MKLSAGKTSSLPGIAVVFGLALANSAMADTVTFGGLITQSTSDGTGPAVNNPALNNIQDADNFFVSLDFNGSISAPGTYSALSGATLLFSDSSASVSEILTFASLSVTPDGGLDDLSLFGCLSTGGGCLVGNSLSANFAIPSSALNSANAAAQLIPGLYPPLDLLEDDGVTDIQGSINSYSYSGSGAGAVPEPSGIAPMILGLIAMFWIAQRQFGAFTRKL